MPNTSSSFGYCFNRDGSRILLNNNVQSPADSHKVLWYHFNTLTDSAEDALKDIFHMDPIVMTEMLSEDTRPALRPYADGLLLTLRCINTRQDEDPEDMVSLHLWIQGPLVITLSHGKIQAILDAIDAVRSGEDFTSRAAFVISLLSRIHKRISDVAYDVEDQVDDIEESLLEDDEQSYQRTLTQLRKKCLLIRRYLIPQRDLIQRILTESGIQFSDSQGFLMRDIADRFLRTIEDFDIQRERIGLINDEINTRINEKMNRTMYVLSIAAALFLPLGFLTGLLGINVGGMPGVDNGSAFYAVVVLSVLLLVAEYMYLRHKKLM